MPSSVQWKRSSSNLHKVIYSCHVKWCGCVWLLSCCYETTKKNLNNVLASTATFKIVENFEEFIDIFKSLKCFYLSCQEPLISNYLLRNCLKGQAHYTNSSTQLFVTASQTISILSPVAEVHLSIIVAPYVNTEVVCITDPSPTYKNWTVLLLNFLVYFFLFFLFHSSYIFQFYCSATEKFVLSF